MLYTGLLALMKARQIFFSSSEVEIYFCDTVRLDALPRWPHGNIQAQSFTRLRIIDLEPRVLLLGEISFGRLNTFFGEVSKNSL